MGKQQFSRIDESHKFKDLGAAQKACIYML
jgi:hypothetical protein